jgi:hypothetical protein
MITGRVVSAKLLSCLAVVGLTIFTAACDGGGGGVTLPDDPSIALSSSSTSFSAMQGGPDPAPQSLTVTNDGDGTLDGLTAGISYPAGQPSGWLSASLSTATAPSTLTLTAATGSLAAGAYTASVAVGSSGAGNSPQRVSVSFTVGSPPPGSPLIALSSTSQSFGGLQGGTNPPAQTVSIINAGEGSLSELVASISHAGGQPTGWLAATLSQTTAPSTLTLSATLASLPAGSYSANVTITSGGAGNSPQTVTVNLTVAPPSAGPLIALSSTSRSFNAQQGGAKPAPQTVSISNGGGGTLTGLGISISYTGGQPTGWLNASLNRRTAPSTLALTASTGSLAAGTYTASVSVTSAAADNSPQTVAVTFTVTPAAVAPRIVFSATSRSFNATQGGANPPAQTVAVTNGGGGNLSSLAVEISYAGGASGWLQASLSGTTAPSTLTLTPVVGSLAPGSYEASVRVSSPAASNSPQTMTVSLTVAPQAAAPTIALSAPSATFSATQGGANPTAQTIQVTNGGQGTLSGLAVEVSYAGSSVTGWLEASLSQTTAPSTLTLGVTVGSLAPGSYAANVLVSSSGVSNSPQTVIVNLTVAPPPAIGLSPRDLTFAANHGGANPEPREVTISNTGGGTLEGLEASVEYTDVVQPASPWLTAELSATSAPSTLRLKAALGGLNPRVYTAKVKVSSPGASNTPQTVTVAFVVRSIEAAQTFSPSEDNLLMLNSTNPLQANSVFRTSALGVGSEYTRTFVFSVEFIRQASLMKFDVQSTITGKTILEAKLRLVQTLVPPDRNGRFRLNAVGASWNPSTITWNLWSSMARQTAGQVDFVAVGSTVTPIELDVTTIVQKWADGSLGNHGFQIWEPNPVVPSLPPSSAARQTAVIHSLETGGPPRRPQLIIRYR